LRVAASISRDITPSPAVESLLRLVLDQLEHVVVDALARLALGQLPAAIVGVAEVQAVPLHLQDGRDLRIAEPPEVGWVGSGVVSLLTGGGCRSGSVCGRPSVTVSPRTIQYRDMFSTDPSLPSELIATRCHSPSGDGNFLSDFGTGAATAIIGRSARVRSVRDMPQP